MPVLLELSAAFPWVRRHRCPLLEAALETERRAPHKQYVETDSGVGWLHHHETDGYVVQLRDGRQIKRTSAQFRVL